MIQAEVGDAQVVPRFERARIELHRPRQWIERFRERTGISEQLSQQGKLVRVVGVVNAMADLLRGQWLGPQRAGTAAHFLFRVLVFVPELRVEVIFASRFLLAPAVGVRPRQPGMDAVVARQKLDGTLPPLSPPGDLARTN